MSRLTKFLRENVAVNLDNAKIDLAQLMLAEAQDASIKNLYNATGFALRNISIVHQQVRCNNLSWALAKNGQLPAGTRVGVIGGGFSAMTIASSIALQNDVIVYILNDGESLLSRMRNKGDIFLSPNLNSLKLPVGFDPAQSSIEPPIFDWKSGYASDVSHQWLLKFRDISKNLPIFLFNRIKVCRSDIKTSGDNIQIEHNTGNAPLEFDIVIDATGFGIERNPFHLVDYSYWNSGSKLTYSSRPRGETVLISGCGDSGIIEALRHAFNDFEHKDVLNFWPYGVRLESYLDPRLDRAFLEEIYPDEEIFGTGNLLPEVFWWLRRSQFRFENTAVAFNANDDLNEIHYKIGKLICTTPKIRKQLRLEIDEILENEGVKLPNYLSMPNQRTVVDKIRPMIENVISHRMKEIAAGIDFEKITTFVDVKAKRSKQKIVLNGLTPNVYNSSMSRVIFWLAAILMRLPNVDYRQGKIESITNAGRGPTTVTFSDGETRKFNYAISRHGLENKDRITSSKRQDDRWGDCLLDPIPSTDNRGTNRYYDEIKSAILDLPVKSDCNSVLINKDIYCARYLAEKTKINSPDSLGDKLFDDVNESELINILKTGNWPRFN